MKRDALEQSWSVMVRMESYFWDLGSFVMKSRAITSNGFALGSGILVLAEPWWVRC